MATLTIYQAKTHFSSIINRALMGEEIIIARGSEPVVTLVPVKKARARRRIGGAKNLVLNMAEDFDAPLKDFDAYM